MNPIKILLATKALEKVGNQLIGLDFNYEEKKTVQKLLLGLIMTLNTSEKSVIPVNRIYEIAEDVLDQLEHVQTIEGKNENI